MAVYSVHFVLILLVASVLFQINNAVRIDINPAMIFETDKGTVNISCVPDTQGGAIQKILVMEVTKSGQKPMVIAKLNTKVAFGKGVENRVDVQYKVVEKPSECYLRLAILDPKKQDSGTYTCVMYYMDDSGVMGDERDSANLSVEKDAVTSILAVVEKQRAMLTVLENKVSRLPDLERHVERLNSTVGQLNQKLTSEENTVTGLTTTVGQLRQMLSTEENNVAALSTTVGQLSQKLSLEKNNVAVLTTTVANLQRKVHLQDGNAANLANLKRNFAMLSEKVNCQSAFSATTTHYTDPNVGDVIQFPEVLMEIGHGYDKHTSIFTAPVTGLYAFNLIVEVGCSGCRVLIDLKVNYQSVGILKVADLGLWDQSSLSTVVKLNRYDQVKAVMKEDHTTQLANAKTVLFNGFLINCL